MAFQKDAARKAVSIRRVAGTAQVLTLLIVNANKSAFRVRVPVLILVYECVHKHMHNVI